MPNVLIVGNRGNMGKRYKAILDYYDIPSCGVDTSDPVYPEPKPSHVIIASPTIWHLEHIYRYAMLNVPILCEKPITTEFSLIPPMINSMKDRVNLRVINQYEHLIDPDSKGDSFYDYWNTGKDGLMWDCINIIGLSKGIPTIKNKSPYWQCMINGQWLSIKDMDRAYMSMVFNWVTNPTQNWDYILHSHQKVAELTGQISTNEENF